MVNGSRFLHRVVVRKGPAVSGENPVPIAMAMIDLVGADELPLLKRALSASVGSISGILRFESSIMALGSCIDLSQKPAKSCPHARGRT